MSTGRLLARLARKKCCSASRRLARSTSLWRQPLPAPMVMARRKPLRNLGTVRYTATCDTPCCLCMHCRRHAACVVCAGRSALLLQICVVRCVLYHGIVHVWLACTREGGAHGYCSHHVSCLLRQMMDAAAVCFFLEVITALLFLLCPCSPTVFWQRRAPFSIG